MLKKLFFAAALASGSTLVSASHEQEVLTHCHNIGVVGPTVESAYYIGEVYNPTQWHGLRTGALYVHKHQHANRHCRYNPEAHDLQSGSPNNY